MIREKLTNYADLVTNQTPYVSFPILEELGFIRHGFSTRKGGVSSGIHESMNLGFNRGDEDDNVFMNYHLFCDSIGVKEENLVFTDQVHKDHVRVATKENCGMGIFKKRTYSEIDAHITNEPDVSLLVFGADCVPILFADPVKRVIGAAHSGWKGTTLKIGARTVEKMEEEFGCNPKDIIAVIGPCICKDCYEISKDVADQFYQNFSKEDADAILTCDGYNSNHELKYHLDLWEANKRILLSAGLTNDHVVVSGLCTMCRSDLFFSHRASKGQRGSMAGIISIDNRIER